MGVSYLVVEPRVSEQVAARRRRRVYQRRMRALWSAKSEDELDKIGELALATVHRHRAAVTVSCEVCGEPTSSEGSGRPRACPDCRNVVESPPAPRLVQVRKVRYCRKCGRSMKTNYFHCGKCLVSLDDQPVPAQPFNRRRRAG